jgi:hypothetical protein
MTSEHSAENDISVAETSAQQTSHKSEDFIIRISRKSLKTAAIILGAAIVVVVVLFFVNSNKASLLRAAVENCALTESEFISLDENGAGLYLDGEGEETVGLPSEDEGCVLNFLEVPASVLDRMGSTTAMMGVQEAEFNGILATWTYHPDNGFDINFSVN